MARAARSARSGHPRELWVRKNGNNGIDIYLSIYRHTHDGLNILQHS